MKVMCHDYEAARKDCPPDKFPVLGFSNGAKHALLPSGQQVNVEPKNRSLPGKTMRRLRNRLRREEKGKQP